MRSSRDGFSLPELLVVLAISVVLISLLLIAVNAVRESGRRVNCQNNLRQLALASQNEFDASKRIPSRHALMVEDGRFLGIAANPFLVFISHMEIAYEAAAGQIWVGPIGDIGVESPPPSALVCPSADRRLGYRLNLGGGMVVYLDRRNDDQRLFRAFSPGTPLSAVTDGLSNTVLISERYSGNDSSSKRYAIAARQTAGAEEEFREACDNAWEVGALLKDAGKRWWSPFHHESTYLHFTPPNDRNVDCWGGGPPAILAIAARSQHAGGVQSALLDGSARWISNGIDPATWKHLGHPSDGETVVPE